MLQKGKGLKIVLIDIGVGIFGLLIVIFSLDLKRLERLGTPPYTDHEKYAKFVKMVDSYGGGMDVGFVKLLWIALRAPEYSLKDYFRWIRGANRGSGPML